jgi:transcriptional regulator with XRE-family HTH domain
MEHEATSLSLPPGFWDQPEIKRALDRNDTAAWLPQAIQAAGVTQREFAAFASFPEAQISQYKHRLRNPELKNITRLADAFGMPCGARQRLGLSPAAPHQPAPADVKTYRLLALADYVGSTGDCSPLRTWRHLAAEPDKAAPWGRLNLLVQPGAAKVGPAVELLTVRTRGLFPVAGVVPARLVERALTRHAYDIGLLLSGTSSRSRRRQLIVASGETSYLAACCEVDLHDYPSAMQQTDTMAKAAREAGDTALAAMALDGQSHFQAAQRNHVKALELIEQARAAITPDEEPGTAAYLWLRTAEEYMYCGQSGNTAHAWRHAEEQYAAVDLARDRNWVRLWLSRDCFDSVRALIYSVTGRQHKARDLAEQVAVRLPEDQGKVGAITLTNLTLAQAQSRLYKTAAATGTRALTAMRAAETATCLARLGCAAATLRNNAGHMLPVQSFLRDFEATAQDLATPGLAS